MRAQEHRAKVCAVKGTGRTSSACGNLSRNLEAEMEGTHATNSAHRPQFAIAPCRSVSNRRSLLKAGRMYCFLYPPQPPLQLLKARFFHPPFLWQEERKETLLPCLSLQQVLAAACPAPLRPPRQVSNCPASCCHHRTGLCDSCVEQHCSRSCVTYQVSEVFISFIH